MIGGVLVNLSSSIAFTVLASNDRYWLALLAGYAPSIPYSVLVIVGVWRTAERHAGDPRHADLARIVTVAGMVLLSVT